MSQIIDGQAVAQQMQAELSEEIKAYVSSGQRPPFLGVILVGNDPASKIYVGRKEKACHEVGIATETLLRH